jgi:hypothetical protein
VKDWEEEPKLSFWERIEIGLILLLLITGYAASWLS